MILKKFTLLIFIIFIVCFVSYSKSRFVFDENSFFYNSNPSLDSNENKKYSSNLIPNEELSAHSSQLVDLGDKLMLLYFAGSKEGARDVKIYQSIYSSGKWSNPRSVLDTKMLSKFSGKYIKKLGNPVVFKDAKNRFNVFIVGVSFGGWSASRIYQFTLNSDLNLEYKGELHLGPFMNLSHLVRTNALNLSDGGYILPLYHEMIKKYPLLLYFDSESRFKYAKRINKKNFLLQPSLVALNNRDFLAAFRTYKDNNDFFIQNCKDLGLTCGELKKSNLKNYDSSSILLKFKDEVLLVHNDGFSNPFLPKESSQNPSRRTLSLFYLSDRENAIFDRLLTIQLAPLEASYPSFVISKGKLHLSYTLDRTQIKHVEIDLKIIEKLISLKKENKLIDITFDDLSRFRD